MQGILGFFSGSWFGYFTASFYSGPSEGVSGIIGSLIFNVGEWKIHLHHWLFFLLFLVIFTFFLRKKCNMSPIFLMFVVGFLTGLIFQGIYFYDDWSQILIKRI